MDDGIEQLGQLSKVGQLEVEQNHLQLSIVLPSLPNGIAVTKWQTTHVEPWVAENEAAIPINNSLFMQKSDTFDSPVNTELSFQRLDHGSGSRQGGRDQPDTIVHLQGEILAEWRGEGSFTGLLLTDASRDPLVSAQIPRAPHAPFGEPVRDANWSEYREDQPETVNPIQYFENEVALPRVFVPAPNNLRLDGPDSDVQLTVEVPPSETTLHSMDVAIKFDKGHGGALTSREVEFLLDFSVGREPQTFDLMPSGEQKDWLGTDILSPSSVNQLSSAGRVTVTPLYQLGGSESAKSTPTTLTDSGFASVAPIAYGIELEVATLYSSHSLFDLVHRTSSPSHATNTSPHGSMTLKLQNMVVATDEREAASAANEAGAREPQSLMQAFGFSRTASTAPVPVEWLATFADYEGKKPSLSDLDQQPVAETVAQHRPSATTDAGLPDSLDAGQNTVNEVGVDPDQGGQDIGGGGGSFGGPGGGGRGGGGGGGDDPPSDDEGDNFAAIIRSVALRAERDWGLDLGPRLGQPDADRIEAAFDESVPDGEPPGELLALLPQGYLLGVSVRQRATRWALALQVEAGRQHRPPRGVVETTFGLVQFATGLRMAVIHYVDPQVILEADRPLPIRMAGSQFPVVLRPSAVRLHSQIRLSAPQDTDGNCWVRYGQGAEAGLLTAHHAILPLGSRSGDSVTIDASRRPSGGRLVHFSSVMDAAVVALTDGAQHGKPWPESSRVGFKPVRYVTGARYIDAEVVELPVVRNGVIPVNPFREPAQGASFYLSRYLSKGDSGCLILDCEPELDGRSAKPYLFYKGTQQNGVERRDKEGIGQMLHQVLRTWNIVLTTRD